MTDEYERGILWLHVAARLCCILSKFKGIVLLLHHRIANVVAHIVPNMVPNMVPYICREADR